MWLRAVVVWLLLMGVEFVHGALRTALLTPIVGDLASRQIGVFIGSLLILVVVSLTVPWIRARTARSLLAVGVFWLVLTMIFELALGRWIFGLSWERLLSDYNLPQGGLLPIGFAVLMFSPLIATRLRRERT